MILNEKYKTTFKTGKKVLNFNIRLLSKLVTYILYSVAGESILSLIFQFRKKSIGFILKLIII